MQAIATIGLDVAKSVFQVHGIDSEGRVTVRRQLKRRYVLAFLPITVCPVTRRISRLSCLGHYARQQEMSWSVNQ
jgi:transposase